MPRSEDRDRLFRSASENENRNDLDASFRSVLSSCQVTNNF